MAFSIVTDTASNLPKAMAQEMGVTLMTFTMWIDGEEKTCPLYPEDYDSHAYYDKLRGYSKVKTSLINSGEFEHCFRPILTSGKDVLYLGMSSGISGTCAAAIAAGRALMEEFPGRQVKVLDSLGCGGGTGLLVCRAWEAWKAGKSLEETYEGLLKDRAVLCEFFTVDDLKFLRQTGRINTATMLVGTMLQVKPLLRGDEEGHIVLCGQVRGRKRTVDALAELYRKRIRDKSLVFISHGDCPQDAEALAEKIRAIAPPERLVITVHEPLSGSHVGPGMLAVFFLGDSRKP